MPIYVDDDLLAYMRQSSSAIHIELRATNDTQTAIRGLKRARQAIFTLRHPDEPDEPYASFACEIERRGTSVGFWFDMADAEAYDEILECALETIVSSLEESGVNDALVTWPESAGRRQTAWVRSSQERFAHLIAADYDNPVPAPAHRGGPFSGQPVVIGQWTRRSPLLTPRARMGATAGREGRIFTIGGALRGPVRTAEAYDPAADLWERIAPLQTGRRGPGVAQGLDGRVYAIGGYETSGRNVTPVEAYDADHDRWESVAPMRQLALNEMAAVTGHSGRIYAIAVMEKREDSPGGPHIFESYDVEADRWTVLTPPALPYSESLALMASADGCLYFVGPLPSHRAVYLDTYDPSTDSWMSASAAPSKRRFLSRKHEPGVRLPKITRGGPGLTVGQDGRVYVISGQEGSRDTRRCDAYCPRNRTWVELDPIPTPRTRPRVLTGTGGCIWAIGGATNLGTPWAENSNAVEVYMP